MPLCFLNVALLRSSCFSLREEKIDLRKIKEETHRLNPIPGRVWNIRYRAGGGALWPELIYVVIDSPKGLLPP